MQNKTVLVTGEPIFLKRHEFLFRAMSQHFENINFLPRDKEWYEYTLPRILIKALYTIRTGSLSKANAYFQKNKIAFILKSQRTEQQIKQMQFRPDIVFHIFGTYSPFLHKSDIPYVIYLDYTVALAEKKWSGWAYFINAQQRENWVECERRTYTLAQHIFCMSSIVKKSLIQDYSIEPEKITVVGSSGDFQLPYVGEKQFGSQQILFNGSDFKRKGGDLVIAAFKKVKQAIPSAKLIIIGKKLPLNENEDGIENPGHVSSRADIHNLFLNTDLVIAPAYCDPFPTFLMEAMNYGIPCIVSANDGMPEIVTDKETGIVISEPTADVLANHIIDLLNNPLLLTSMSHAARDKIKNKLNWNKIAEQIAKQIAEILSEKVPATLSKGN
ncbi:MAG: glycosyltransferase family 4 protein [Scytonematopsis contorta HA4267-MV1]|jgi:glycosyltransferase involved in cell wall biosynthesis|nr:glycosyltransferase family 4 protein [Scytonematopsis contorta HA4267-MV1]